MKEIIDRFRRFVVYIGLLSFAIDMLMLTQPIFMIAVFDKVMSGYSNETLFVLTGLALYAVLIMSLLENLRTRLFERFGATWKTRIAPRMLEMNLRGLQSSELLRDALDDVNELENFLTGPGIKAFFAIPWVPIFIGILYLFHPALAALAAIVSVLLVALAILENRLTASHQEKAQQAVRKANVFGMTARRNVEAVASLGMHDAISSRWARLNMEYLDFNGRAARTSATIKSVAKFVRVSGQLLSLALGAWLIINLQDVTPGVMIAAMIIMGKVLSPIEQIIGAWRSFVSTKAAYGRLKTLLDEDKAAQVPALKLPRPHGEIRVEKLFLQFGPTQRVLLGINFQIPPGGSLGVVGPSGSGKTSLARMLVGLMKPTQGHVRLDGAEVSQWAQTDLGRYVGYLPQDTVLFPGTIAENIARMQDPKAHNDAVVAAAKKARVHDMIVKLPKGYDTEVGDGGSRLSGGQRQQVGLARALFGNPSLLVLDEPNANLDSTSEFALSEVIRSLKVSRVTIVIVAHKPSVIKDMDYLLVLQAGQQQMFGKAADVLRELMSNRMLAGPAPNLAVSTAAE